MPYSISQGGGTCGETQWAVLSDSGRTMGCHSSKQEALDQQAALYANDPDASKESSHVIPAPQMPRGRMMAMRHTATGSGLAAQRHTAASPHHTTRDRKA
jgi:hypothetical protein